MTEGLLDSEPRAGLLRLWLNNGVKRNRKMARDARAAFAKPYMAAAASVMADLHDQCAELYAAKLRELEAR